MFQFRNFEFFILLTNSYVLFVEKIARAMHDIEESTAIAVEIMLQHKFEAENVQNFIFWFCSSLAPILLKIPFCSQ